ncbi:MAG: L,D-transpeptidase [Streptococcaceae bacterium]|nr:L,D-transpeptidase [Streptococcaceae bacterium]
MRLLKSKVGFFLALTVLIFLAIGGYQIYRKSHFACGASVLGKSISLKTVDEAYDILQKTNHPFKVSLTGADETYTIIVPVKYKLTKNLLRKQLPEKRVELSKNPKFNREIKAALAKLDFKEQPGENAKLSFNGNIWEIIPEGKSTNVDHKKLENTLVQQAFAGKVKTLKLSQFFIPVKITAKDPTLKKRLQAANKLVQKKVILDVNDQKVELTKDILASFLNSEGKLDSEKITTYLTNKLNSEVSTFDKDVLWTNPNDGVTYQFLNNHAWGWDIKIKDATKLLQKELTKNDSVQTINLPIDGDPKQDFIITSDFVWINLLDQTMHVYRGGSEAVLTRIISGRNNKGTATSPGFHTIGYKKTDTKLEGEMLDGSKYSVPVKYFEPLQSRGADGNFYYTGIGIHDSNKDYGSVDAWMSNAGSNGCINTPPDAMEQVWAQTYPGMPVIITGDRYANSPGAYDKPVDLGRVAD